MKMRAIDPTEPLGQAASFGRHLQSGTGLAEEHELKKRLRFEGLLSDLSARLVAVPSDKVDVEIEYALNQIRQFFQVDRCGFLKASEDKTSWRITHISFADGVPPLPVNTDLPRALFPWVYRRLIEEHEVMLFSVLDELPAEADIDRETYKAWGIRSVASIPIAIGGIKDYFMTITADRCERVWPEEYVPRLRILGEILAHAIERCRADSALRESERRYRLLAENARDVIFTMDNNYRFTYVSPSIRHLRGVTPEEAMKEDFKDTLTPASYLVVHELTASRTETESAGKMDTVNRLEIQQKRKDGSLVWVEVLTQAILDEDGRRIGLTGISRDITDRKRVEELLEERLRVETLLADISSTFIHVPAERLEEEILEAQRRVCRALDLDRSSLWQTSEETNGRLTLTHIHPLPDVPVPEGLDPTEQFPWTVKQVLRGKTVVLSSVKDLAPEAARDLEAYRYYGTRSTVVVPLSSGGSPVFGALTFAMTTEEREWPEEFVKQLQFVSQIFANALARKRTEMTLRQSEARLSLAAASAEADFWEMHVPTGRLWITERTRKRVGIRDDEEPTFESMLRFIHPEDRERVQKTLRDSLTSGTDLSDEYRLLLPDGSIRWVTSRGRRHSGPTGKTDRLMGVSFDITDRKKAETEAYNARKQLLGMERLSRLGELTASLAHELNQPLTSILTNSRAALRFIESGVADMEELKEILKDIASDDKRAGDIIRSLRSMVKPEEGTQDRVVINDLIREVVSLFNSESIIRNIKVETDYADSLPPVTVEKIQIQQVMINLMMNAAESMTMSSPGDRRIVIETGLTGDGLIRVGVRDFGPGIRPEEISNIFQPFFTTKRTGLGLGLSLSRSIVEAHGGHIRAENNADRGATFSFDLPSEIYHG